MLSSHAGDLTLPPTTRDFGLAVLAALFAVTPAGLFQFMLLLHPVLGFTGDPVLDVVRHILLRLGAVWIVLYTFVFVTRHGAPFRLPASGLKAPILLYLGTAVVSIAISIVLARINSLRAALAIVTLLLLIGLAHSIPVWISTKELLKRSAQCILWSLSVVALLGLTEVIGQVMTQSVFHERITAFVFHDPNIFARFLVVGIFMVLSFLLFARGQVISTWAGIALLLLLSVNLLFSLSRSGIATLIVGLIVLAFLAPKKKRVWMLVITVAAGGTLAAVMFASRTFTGNALIEPSNLNRIALILGGVEIIKDHWLLGVGYTNFGYYFGQTFLESLFSVSLEAFEFAGYATSIHNWLIEVWAEQGIFGVVAFLWFFTSLFRRLRAVRRKTEDPQLYALLTAVTLILFTFLFHGFFYHTYMSQFPFWLFLGLTLATMKVAEERFQTLRRS